MGAVAVTMDDAGISPAVTGALERCLEAGALDRVSVMASGGDFDAASELAASSGLPVSAHLNCIEPPFLTDGRFPGSLLSWTLHASALAPAVGEEWRRQLEALLSRGLMLTGLDSHRHLHHLPPLQEVALELAAEFGIRRVRAAVVPSGEGGLRGLYLRRLGRRLARSAADRGLVSCGLMFGFGRAGRVDRRYLESVEERLGRADLPKGTEAELVVHPALEPVWSRGQPKELELLTSDWYGEWSDRCRG